MRRRGGGTSGSDGSGGSSSSSGTGAGGGWLAKATMPAIAFIVTMAAVIITVPLVYPTSDIPLSVAQRSTGTDSSAQSTSTKLNSEAPSASTQSSSSSHLSSSSSSSSSSSEIYSFLPEKNTEYWGNLVQGGWGASNLQPTARDCHDSCVAKAELKTEKDSCNAWVYHPEKKECWLKNQRDPSVPSVRASGPLIPWTSGVVHKGGRKKFYYEKGEAPKVDDNNCIHTIITSGGGEYMAWQTRLMYETYLTVRKKNTLLKRFTRVLHADQEDELSNYIHTIRFDPEKPACGSSGKSDQQMTEAERKASVTCSSFPVGPRAAALERWLKSDDSKQCSHIFLAEPDYLFIQDLNNTLILPPQGEAIGSFFDYIVPSYPDIAPLISKFLKPPLTPDDVPESGNAPTLVSREDLNCLIPEWRKVVDGVHQHSDVVTKFGWVRDMYAWDIATALCNVHVHLPATPRNPLMVQIPKDHIIGEAAVIHYTWGTTMFDTTPKKKKIWGYDKRGWKVADKTRRYPSPIDPLPPFEEGLTYQDGYNFTTQLYHFADVFVKTFNGAIDSLKKGDDSLGYPRPIQ